MNAAEYRAWWETNAPAPYGFCWCGCGGRTGIAARSFPDRGWVAGEPRRFIRDHQARKTNAADQAEICRRYRAGEKLALIAEDYGIAVGTVSKILKDNGVSELNEEARSFTHAEYRLWWAQNASVPYGYCWCGCEAKTRIAERTEPGRKWVEGEPIRFIWGHQTKSTSAAQNAEILRRFQAGEKPAFIADDHGIQIGTLDRILARGGVPKSDRRDPSRSLTPEEYRRWWAKKAPAVPYGRCWCGCGQPTEMASHTDPTKSWVKGEPIRYLGDHLNAARTAWATEEQKEEICRRYLEGAGSYALAREFGVHGSLVGKMLDQRGIARRTASENKRIHSCNHAFFDAIDSEEKAYWLGFMAADGNVVTGRPIIKLALAFVDRDHLLKFRDAVESTHAITDYTTTAGHHGAKLSIASPQLTEGLAKHGISPNKTFTVEWPNNIAPQLLSHYLRGYFDGDGSFKVRRSPTGAPVLGWSIVGNQVFCLGAQGYMMDAIGVNRTKLYVPRNSPNIRKLTYAGRRQVSRIARFMYEDATVYLPRKHQKVAHLL